MADETEYRIPIIADIGDLLAKFQEAGNAAQEMGDKMASAGDKGKEGGEKLGEGAEKGAEKLKELKEGIDKSTEAVGKMMTGWEGLLGVIGAGAVAEIMSKIAETTIELGTNLGITAAELGVSADAARGFIETMDQLGISSSAVSGSIRRLEMDAAAGGKQLHRLGIDIHDVNGNLKDGMTLFTESVQHIRELANSAEQTEAAYMLWGRQGMQILANLDEILPRLKDNTEEQKNNTEVNKLAQAEGLKLSTILSQLNSTWEDFAVRVAPAVELALKGLIIVLKEAAIAAEMMAISLGQALSLAGKIGQIGADLAAAGANAPEEGGGLGFTDEKVKKYSDSLTKLKTDTDSYGDAWKKTGQEMLDAFLKGNAELDKQIFGEEKAGEQIERNRHLLPPAGHGGKGPAALDAEQMENALDKADQKMQQMAQDEAKIGSEAQMAAKASESSYADLAAKVQADWVLVQQKHDEMVAAIESGSKKAASEATTAWHTATEKWKADFDAAKAKAVQDMKDIKSAADTMSSEVSGILNSAISGKLNWAQELNKVLSKMVDELTKYVFEMVGLMLKGETMSQAAQTAGHGNMMGELVGWVAKMLGVKTAGNAADTAQETGHEAAITTAKATAQATQAGILASGQAAQGAILKTAAVTQGTTQAGVAAANTMAALTPIPYVGPAIAAATAPTIFSETMAYAVAEAGFDVPPGLKPLTQLHPREMVLPESLATGVRNMTSGSGSGIPGAQVNQNINLQAWDGASVVDMLLGNGSAIAGALQGALRSGLVLNTGG